VGLAEQHCWRTPGWLARRGRDLLTLLPQSCSKHFSLNYMGGEENKKSTQETWMGVLAVLLTSARKYFEYVDLFFVG